MDAQILAAFVLIVAVVLIGACCFFIAVATINRIRRRGGIDEGWSARIIAAAQRHQLTGPAPAMTADERMRVVVMGHRADDERTARTLAHLIDAVWGDELTDKRIAVSARGFHDASGLDATQFYHLVVGDGRIDAERLHAATGIEPARSRALHKAARRVRPAVHLDGVDLIDSAWSVTALRRRYQRGTVVRRA